jgi:hypothetical protein
MKGAIGQARPAILTDLAAAGVTVTPSWAGTRCTWCGKRLRGEPVMLEFDQRTNTYHAGGVPALVSQGWFPFGANCARTVLSARSHGDA